MALSMGITRCATPVKYEGRRADGSFCREPNGSLESGVSVGGEVAFMRCNRVIGVALAVLVAGAMAPTMASQTAAAGANFPVPRFASFASDRVYMREGPTYGHRILWVYHRKGLPVQVLAQYDVWRRVKDSQGAIGWVHASMISEIRTILVTAKSRVPVRRSDDPHSPMIALAQSGVVARLEACGALACEIESAGIEGWIEKKNIWGVRPGEMFR